MEKVDGGYHISYTRDFDTSHNFLFTPTANKLQKSEVHLETIAIDLSPRDLIIAAMTRDWKKSDTLASRLPDLQKVIWGFESRKDMLRFVNKIVDTQMENLRDAGKLRYAVLDYVTDRWMRVSPASDKLERTYEYLSQFISGI
ncbi:hypothetical protein PHLCEN_2v65 [Hermanssonia centrifuga]|uniref:Uncharacterized protein n=1 Tax=Hermanssonia centrifuga TaxID=98765 RepID=A0A2R6S746_9APHY|nr:hypothetical protein PHLCEN_2v65 [Hermanssonia centrifuga]